MCASLPATRRDDALQEERRILGEQMATFKKTQGIQHTQSARSGASGVSASTNRYSDDEDGDSHQDSDVCR